MDQYYKTLRSSETGRKFLELNKIGHKCHKASIAFVEKHGFKRYRSAAGGCFGGISSCVDPVNTPNPKVWKVDKAGKNIEEERKKLPVVYYNDYNVILGFNDWFRHIGWGFDSEYIGISVSAEWCIQMPPDCEEITASEYMTRFCKKRR